MGREDREERKQAWLPNNTCLVPYQVTATVFDLNQGEKKQANRKTKNTCLTSLPTIILSEIGTTQGRRAAWLSTCMGCGWSQVQILPPRFRHMLLWIPQRGPQEHLS